MDSTPRLTNEVNATRYRVGQRQGHYESFFQRANHPTRPLAFWIRYTLFSPHHRPEDARGELWAIWFDGERGQHRVGQRAVPLAACRFAPAAFSVQIAEARLQPGWLQGTAGSDGQRIGWDLTYTGTAEPLLLLPAPFYTRRWPAAKSLVGRPLAVYNGVLRVQDRIVEVVDWVGSQNHNWGRRHTDEYAWGQVAGFDTHPASFLEVATARLKLGPWRLPPVTLLVLRHNGAEIRLNTLRQAWRARAVVAGYRWRFHTETDAVRVEGVIRAKRTDGVRLSYANPPGGVKTCWNSKIAACELRLVRKERGGPQESETLRTDRRAAFEILTDPLR